MDHVASVLLAFPGNENLADNEIYNAAAVAHVQRLNQLKKDAGELLAAHATQLLQVSTVYHQLPMSTYGY